ncbi:MAG: DUF3179 domain-containing protein [Candidatus Thiodiazotropha sp. (ex Codakia orbicularis)]|nr:DUF3179 domain-containing protein [Candidatus Thiodiazotropha sp. (ex Codakia orbicularis)]
MAFNRLITLLFLAGGIYIGPAEARSYKSGFDVTDALVPIEQILPGGPPKDGIPSIDNPKFLPVSKVDFLQPEDRVLGLSHNGFVRAYPIAIMNWHEIVNDRFGSQPVAVTFCPLCGTGIAFKAEHNNKPLSFGVSGLLYNSDVLLYDRTSESLWSQIKMQAISGKFKGEHLEPIALYHTTWSDWIKRHPDSQVLSDDTGFARNYRRSPYGDYETNRSIYFPVEFAAKGYHPKERVLGVNIGGVFKAYPFAELAKTSGRIADSVGGESIEIEYDIDNQTASAIDAEGKTIPTVIAFWFAWYAFHPDGLLFKWSE